MINKDIFRLHQMISKQLLTDKVYNVTFRDNEIGYQGNLDPKMFHCLFNKGWKLDAGIQGFVSFTKRTKSGIGIRVVMGLYEI